MEPEDVVDVLRRMLSAVSPGGTVLDLQAIPPDPLVEAGGEPVCEIDGEPLLRKADAAVAAVDARIAAGDLAEEAVDDHDVLRHFRNGAELADHVERSIRRLPEAAAPSVRALGGPCVIRERSRLRRLRRLP